MADKPQAAEGEKAPAKSKKMLIIIIAAVLVLAIGGGAAFFVMKQRAAAAAAAEEGGEAAPKPAAVAHDTKATPPVYLPMDNMVVNLADPGGERVAQVGVTLVVADEKTAAIVKGFLPSIRSGVLLLLSQNTAQELLSAEGKEKLAKGILREASVPFGGGDEEEEDESTTKKKKKRKVVEYPVTDVLFSSFIVQ